MEKLFIWTELKMLSVNKYVFPVHCLISSVSLALCHYRHRQRKSDRWQWMITQRRCCKQPWQSGLNVMKSTKQPQNTIFATGYTIKREQLVLCLNIYPTSSNIFKYKLAFLITWEEQMFGLSPPLVLHQVLWHHRILWREAAQQQVGLQVTLSA